MVYYTTYNQRGNSMGLSARERNQHGIDHCPLADCCGGPLFIALHQCAMDEEKDVYDFLEDQPRITLITKLVDKMKENGYVIVKETTGFVPGDNGIEPYLQGDGWVCKCGLYHATGTYCDHCEASALGIKAPRKLSSKECWDTMSPHDRQKNFPDFNPAAYGQRCQDLGRKERVAVYNFNKEQSHG